LGNGHLKELVYQAEKITIHLKGRSWERPFFIFYYLGYPELPESEVKLLRTGGITMNLRVKSLRNSLNELNIDALLVTGKLNRNYLSGFTGTDCVLWVGQKKAVFVTDFRYTRQAQKQVQDMKILETPPGKGHLQSAIDSIIDSGIQRLGFESHLLSHYHYELIKKWLKGKGIKLVSVIDVVEKVRMVKSSTEINLIKKANQISMAAFESAHSQIRPGIREIEIAKIYEEEASKRGGEGLAFDTIVASGWRAGLPHGVASSKKIKSGDLVVFDFGVKYKGYHSDCTRTLMVGKPSPKQIEIYQIVKEAQAQALKKVRAGVSTKQLDQVARDIISQAGYGKYFGHSLGHGVGLDIHEGPRLAQSQEMLLQPGMVVTVEPGIYLDKIGGVRIEDLVVVTETGHRVLTSYTKEMVCL